MSAAVKLRERSAPKPTGDVVNIGGRLLLDDVSWNQYEAICEVLSGRSALRLTYDQGSLEFMVKSPRHGWFDRRLSIFVEILAEETEQGLECMGDMNFRKKELNFGFEPDDWFWIQHEHQMRGRGDWDPSFDPPPDLTIESEVAKSALDRMAIFAAYGIPEVWRFDGRRLHVHLLQPDGTYSETGSSLAFPRIAIRELTQFMRPSIDWQTAKKQVRVWVRKQLRKKK